MKSCISQTVQRAHQLPDTWLRITMLWSACLPTISSWAGGMEKAPFQGTHLGHARSPTSWMMLCTWSSWKQSRTPAFPHPETIQKVSEASLQAFCLRAKRSLWRRSDWWSRMWRSRSLGRVLPVPPSPPDCFHGVHPWLSVQGNM